MSSGKKISPERPDKGNPEWTWDDVKKACPAAEVLSRHIGSDATGEVLRRGRGRPPKEKRKVNQTLRIDPEVLEADKRMGRGWQTRINAILRANMPENRE